MRIQEMKVHRDEHAHIKSMHKGVEQYMSNVISRMETMLGLRVRDVNITVNECDTHTPKPATASLVEQPVE